MTGLVLSGLVLVRLDPWKRLGGVRYDSIKTLPIPLAISVISITVLVEFNYLILEYHSSISVIVLVEFN